MAMRYITGANRDTRSNLISKLRKELYERGYEGWLVVKRVKYGKDPGYEYGIYYQKNYPAEKSNWLSTHRIFNA